MSHEPGSRRSEATTAELVAAVLAAPDEDEAAWQPALQELQARPTRGTSEIATALLTSDAMPERELGGKGGHRREVGNEIIDTVHGRRQPMIPASAASSCRPAAE